MKIYDMNNWARRRIEADVTGFPVRSIYNEIQVKALQGPVFCVWDGRGGNQRRKKLFPGYKEGRNVPDGSIFAAFSNLKQVLQLTKAISIEAEGYEGDDTIATLVQRHLPHETIHIHSTDADFTQLPNVTIDKTDPPAPPHLVRLYKTMVGDKSDKIPGIKLFGEKSWYELPDDTKLILVELFTNGQPIDWTKVSMGKASQNWIAKQENELLIRTFWTIAGFYDVPDELLQPVIGVDAPHHAWRIMKDAGL